MPREALKPRRRIFIPEVVQTSDMDCGPASLKCLLDGFGISASYGRLREACQTTIDGASIDTLEEVAVQLGLEAEQIMIPLEHVLLPEAQALPAIAVVRNPQGLTHFIVIWSCQGGFVQVMDPARGRRWMTSSQLRRWLYIHAMAVEVAAWRNWAASEESLGCLRRGLADLHASRELSTHLIDRAVSDESWRSLAGLQACVRMIGSIPRSLVRRAKPELVESLFEQVTQADLSWDETFAKQYWPTIPAQYWSALPAPPASDGGSQLLVRGAVLVRARGHQNGSKPVHNDDSKQPRASTLSPELAAAINEQPDRPMRELFRTLRADGLLEPMVLVKALLIGSGAVLVQAILFRSLLDIGRDLDLAEQRLAAFGLLLVFLFGMLILNLPVAAGVLRLGRRLEARLRIAILSKLARLDDRYLRSRLISDMAERSHNVDLLRQLPNIGVQLFGSTFQLLMTIAGIIWLAPASAPLAVTCGAVATGLPLIMQPLLAERDLRLRNHSGALSRFYLDAMLGLIPIRAHAAEHAVRYMHERLLLEWGRAGLKLQRLAISLNAIQFVTGFGLAIWLLISHVTKPGEAGSLLLLMFWALSIPALGGSIGSTICQYPAYRNIVLRLLEPLGAPEADSSSTSPVPANGKPVQSEAGVRIDMVDVSLSVSGHRILEHVDLAVDPGSHVAIVGPSGAGKSSLVGLLLGWTQTSNGRILVDGLPLDNDRLKRLREQTAWVDPTVQLWNRSLEYNLRYGASDHSMASFGQIVEMAELRELLESLPDGLQTALGESGALVSGGEGQRVRLARAMLHDEARLVILDEPFAALDRPRREKLIAKARQIWRHATLLYITHNISEAAAFGRVLVIQNGRIVEDGVPGELLEREDSHYRGMYDSDAAVRSRFMSSEFWRRFQLRNGRLVENNKKRLLRNRHKPRLGKERERQLEDGTGASS